MRSVASTVCTRPDVSSAEAWRQVLAGRISDYAMLCKPRISSVVLLTVAGGYLLAAPHAGRGPLPLVLLGVGCVAIASSILNQWFERRTDARMQRTCRRPLAAGRVGSFEACAVGIGLAVSGVLLLAAVVNGLTALLAAGTLAMYVGLYTPLKRWTPLSTVVGAVPGAMPPVLGWTAAGGELDRGSFALFTLLFLWQFPHFLAIAWIYQADYARAGLKMLPCQGAAPRLVGALAVAYSLALIPLSLQPSMCALAGPRYLAVALLCGLIYLGAAARFAWRESRETARSLLLVSLFYLLTVLGALVWDHCQLLA